MKYLFILPLYLIFPIIGAVNGFHWSPDGFFLTSACMAAGILIGVAINHVITFTVVIGATLVLLAIQQLK